MKRFLQLTVAASVVLAPPPPARAEESSLRCDGGIISLGDTKIDLLGKCGPPTLQEQSLRDRVLVETGEGRPPSAVVSVSRERWTYDFGPNRFLYVLTLDDGRLARIERGGYGYSAERPRPPASPARRCDSSAIRTGALKLDLLAKCGEPAAREVRQEKRLVPSPHGGRGSPVWVDVETWTYDFGPNQFTAIVVLEDGKVASVERGGYGYAR